MPAFIDCWRWICSCFFLFHGGSVVLALNIGVVVNPNSWDGIEQMIAVEVAVDQLNSSALPIFLNFKNSTTAGPAVVVEDLIDGWRADAVLVGAHTWTEEALMAEVKDASMAAQVPLVTFPNGVGTLSPATSWPNLVRMPGRLSSQIQCIVDLVEGYSWRRVIVLYEDDGFGGFTGGSISFLSKALQGIGSDVERYKAFPRYDSLLKPTTIIEEGLKKVNESKFRVFILVQASPEFATDLFRQATYLGMMTEGYVWITNNGITRRLSSSIMSSYIQGVVELVNFVNKSNPNYGNFFPDFRRRYKPRRTDKELAIDHADPSVFSLLAYDVIQAIIKASKAEEKLSSDNITGSSFRGLSGYIQFNNRELSPTTNETILSILNVMGSGVRELGNCSQQKGFLSNEHGRGNGVEVFRSIYWPGGPLRTPGGWDILDVLIPINGTFSQFIGVTDKGDYSGFSIKVFEEALQIMPYHLRVNYSPFNGVTYNEMVKQVHFDKRYTAAVGDITILPDRLKYVDFTVSYMDSGLLKLVSLEHRLDESWIFLKPFTWRMWLSITILSIYMGLIVWWLKRGLNSEGNRPEQLRQNEITAGLWFPCPTIFFSQGNLHRNLVRVAVLVWLFVALVIIQSYTASLASILRVQKLQPKARNNVDEKIGCNNSSFVCPYLEDVLDYRKAQIYKVPSEDDYPPAFLSGKITAAFLESPYIRIFLSSKHGKNYTVTGHTYKLGGFGFAFEKGSALTSDVSNAILRLVEDGTLKRLTEETFHVNIDSCLSNEAIRETDNISLDVDSFWTLLLTTAIVSTVVAILLFLLRRFHDRLPGWFKRLAGSSSHSDGHDHATQSATVRDVEMQDVHTIQPSTSREVETQYVGSTRECEEAPLLRCMPSSTETVNYNDPQS